MTLTPPQEAALSHLRKAYFGPEEGADEVLFNRPSLQYAVGMLFPIDGASPSAPEAVDAHDFLLADEIGRASCRERVF